MSINIDKISLNIKGVDIIKDISFTINPGELITILGPNGSGKSTLLKVISGDVLPTKGLVDIDDVPLTDMSFKTQALKRSVMSQSQQILYDYSVAEIIEMGWVDYGNTASIKSIKQKCNNVAKECFVDHLLKRNFNTLSGGEQRRVHFARTLLQIDHHYESIGSRYMFLDEPTANLDLLFELQMIRLLKKKAKNGIGVLLIIHDLNLASKFSDKIAILKKGNLIAYGEPFEVFKSKTLSDIFGLAMDVDPKTLKVTYY